MDVLPKNEVSIDGIHIRILTTEKITGTKHGTIRAIVDKILEQTGKLTEHGVEEVDTIGELAAMHIVDEEG